jgi:hypothetical protein
MERSHFWEANNHSASQKMTRLLYNLEGSLPWSQEPMTEPYPGSYESSPQHYILFV